MPKLRVQVPSRCHLMSLMCSSYAICAAVSLASQLKEAFYSMLRSVLFGGAPPIKSTCWVECHWRHFAGRLNELDSMSNVTKEVYSCFMLIWSDLIEPRNLLRHRPDAGIRISDSEPKKASKILRRFGHFCLNCFLELVAWHRLCTIQVNLLVI